MLCRLSKLTVCVAHASVENRVIFGWSRSTTLCSFVHNASCAATLTRGTTARDFQDMAWAGCRLGQCFDARAEPKDCFYRIPSNSHPFGRQPGLESKELLPVRAVCRGWFCFIQSRMPLLVVTDVDHRGAIERGALRKPIVFHFQEKHPDH